MGGARRAAARTASGPGSLLENRTRTPRRRGGRATSARARTVLVRAARMAGTSVAASATASATPSTSIALVTVNAGAPGVPISAAPGSVSSGAISHPTPNPTTAAKSANATFSIRKVVAMRAGVPPTAFSSPTRRAYSERRRPTRTATLAIASKASRTAPGASTDCASWTSRPSADASPATSKDRCPRRPLPEVRRQEWMAIGERRCVGRVARASGSRRSRRRVRR